MKNFLMGLCAIVVFGAGGAFYATRDHGPTHPALKVADLPPLIPTRAFYADPNATWDYVASADGTHVAYRQSRLTGRSVAIRNVASSSEIATLPIGIQHIRWHPTEPLLRFVYQGHDWEMDPKEPDRSNWKRTSPVKLSGGWLKNQIAWEPQMPIMTWGKMTARSDGDMWLVSQDGHDAERIAEGNENTQYWVFNDEMTPVLRVDSLDPATERMMRYTPDGWKLLTDVSLNDLFVPVTNVQSDGTLMARSNRGRDKVALVRFDTQTGEEVVKVENADTDINLPTALTHRPEPDILRLGPASLDRIALTERGEVFLDILAEFPQPISLGAVYPTASGRFVTAAISAQSTSYQHLLIDLEDRSFQVLAEDGLRDHKESLVQEKLVRFSARDGTEIPAVLTHPKGVSGPIPYIVHVHGGPAQHVSLGYAHGTQFLVNRGYGVLSVNFRGSTGFGKAFQAKGFRQFGRAMQDDVTDAALWLISEELADPKALVVMGESYGGYVAALAMTQEPTVFTAGVAEFPMLDVEFQTKHHPGFWKNGLDAWWRYFGRTKNSSDLAHMRELSPTNRADQLRGPLLVLAGEQDQIIAVQQVRTFQTKTEEAGKDVRFHYFPNAGHGVSHWRDRLRRARLLEDFLAEQVGGRSGGFEFAERAPSFID